MRLLPLLHRPADLRGRALDRDLHRRPDRDARAAHQRVSRRRAAVGRGPGRSTPAPTRGCCPKPWRRRSRSRSTASRTCSTCRPQATSDGVLTLTVTFRVGTDVDLAQVQVQNRVSQALPRLPEEVRQLGVTTVKSSPNFIMVVHLVSPDNRYDDVYLRNYGLLQIKDVIGRIPGHRPGPGLRRRRLRHAGLAGPRQGGGPRPDRQRRGERHPRAERPGRGRRGRRAADAGAGRLPAQRERARPPARREGVRRHHPQDRRRTARSPGSATWRASSSPPATTRSARCWTTRTRSASASSRRRGRTRCSSRPPCAQTMEELKKNFPAGRGVPDRLRPDHQRAGRHPRGGQDAVRGDPAGGARGGAVPPDLARVDHSAGGGADLDRGHVRRSCSASGSRSTRCRCSGWCSPSASWWTTPSWWSRTSSATSRPASRRATPPYKAMEEVSGPIIAIGLVLCAVFVPVAFLSGLTGEFYRQFALTIAFSTVISAVNSLTLSPALERHPAQVPRARRPTGSPACSTAGSAGSSGPSTGCSSAARSATARPWPASSGASGIALAVYAGLLALTLFGFNKVPHGFVPTQDKQYLVAFAQLPDAATLDRTETVIRQMADIGMQAAGRGERGAVPRPLHQRLRQRARTPASSSSPLKPFDERHGKDEYGLNIAGRAQRQVRRHPGRVRGRVPAAAGERPRPGRRVQAGAGGPGRPGRDGAERRHPGADREGVSDARAGRASSPATGSTCRSSRSRSTGRR